MKKLSVIVLLLSVILLSFSFVILKSAANGSDENYFNRHLRPYFAATPWLREVLNLHFDGDSAQDYLGQDYEKILIEVDIMDAVAARIDVLDKFKGKIQEVTGKPTSYIISDRNVRYDRELGQEQIRTIAAKHRDHKSHKDTAAIYMLYGSRSADRESLLGQTYQEYGIIVFAETMAERTGDDYAVQVAFEFSTALHEFGHQLGLPHNTEPGCLMNDQAGIREGYNRSDEIITDFCEYEKRLLSNFRDK